jgi:selenocysteine-specific elongation factor
LNSAQFEAAGQRLVAHKAVYRTSEPQPLYVTSQRFQRLKQQLMRCCEAELARRRPSRLVLVSAVLAAVRGHASPQIAAAALDHLVGHGELVRRGDRMGLPTGAELSHHQRQLLDLLLADCSQAGPRPPTLKEFAGRSGCTLKDLEPLVQVAVDEGRLVRLSPEMAIASEALESLRRNLVDYFQLHPAAKISEIRQRWEMTRKHAVPIFEFFDRRQVTARSGDLHSAGPRIAESLSETGL